MWRPVFWYVDKNFRENLRLSCSGQKMNASGLSEMVVPIYENARHHIPEALNLRVRKSNN
jgi:hypothetical protein